jgi:hypothetical protein
VLEDGHEPVREKAKLAHEQGEVLSRDELEIPDGRELCHAGRALYGHAEVLILVVLRLRAVCGGGSSSRGRAGQRAGGGCCG